MAKKITIKQTAKVKCGYVPQVEASRVKRNCIIIAPLSNIFMGRKDKYFFPVFWFMEVYVA